MAARIRTEGALCMETKIPPGTLDLLILKTLARVGEMHGYEIARLYPEDLR